MDDLDSGGKARTRCPTFKYVDSGAWTTAVMILPVLSIRPPVLTQVWIGRTETAFRVSVTSLAWLSLTAAPAALVLSPRRYRRRAGSVVLGRVCSRTPCACR